jgi:phenol 2-monooxygenase
MTIVFPGDVRKADRKEALLELASQLDSAKGPSHRYTPPGEDIDSVIETITVLQTPHKDVQAESLSWPTVLVPEQKPYNVKAVDTLYSDEESWHDGHGHAYEGYGIDPAVGAVVLVRPDQYVSAVYGLEDFQSIASFFAKFMLEPRA